MTLHLFVEWAKNERLRSEWFLFSLHPSSPSNAMAEESTPIPSIIQASSAATVLAAIAKSTSPSSSGTTTSDETREPGLIDPRESITILHDAENFNVKHPLYSTWCVYLSHLTPSPAYCVDQQLTLNCLLSLLFRTRWVGTTGNYGSIVHRNRTKLRVGTRRWSKSLLSTL